MASSTKTEPKEAEVSSKSISTYAKWIDSIGVPIHKGYSVSDMRTLELGWWPERECNVAFLQLAGQEGISETRITEIPPAKTLPKMKFALDEAVYVAEGRGFTTVWSDGDSEGRTFEWQKHSVFMLPRSHTFQISNSDGTKPARLLQYNYLPVVMEAMGDPKFIFNNPYEAPSGADSDLYAEAKVVSVAARMGNLNAWQGNFFPDMTAWDKLEQGNVRGAGARNVNISFPNSPIRSHMAVFPAGTYKKAHRHGPGVVVLIPAGEGFSVMWPEGAEDEKVYINWQAGSLFVPPDRWFHQHFNVGTKPARYLALKMPDFMRMSGERVLDPVRDQIEYVVEDPAIRTRFADEVSKRGGTSLMPDEAYTNQNFDWMTVIKW